MKKSIYFTFALLAILSVSCADESSQSSLQTASVWRSTNFTDTTLSTEFDYYEFRFVSSSTLELWVKSKANETPEKVNQTYTYAIKDNSISIVYNDVKSTGTIDNTTMNVSEDGISLKFVKI